MIQDIRLRLPPQDANDPEMLRAAALRVTGLLPSDLSHLSILHRAIDARQRHVLIELTLRLFIGEAPPNDPPFAPPPPTDLSSAPSALIIGAGPAGLFAALRLIQSGIRPILIERGKSVHERKRDLAQLHRNGSLQPESNYAFGEGGAGAFSDGKLYTRSHKRGSVEDVLRTLCNFGASPNILIDAHPHIGSDRLPLIVERIRNFILACGGTVLFSTRMDALIIRHHSVIGIRTHTNQEFLAPVILATGHSARDVYRHLHSIHLPLQPKPLAIGLRLEHPQALIDALRYHSTPTSPRSPHLPPAEYAFTTQVLGRGVYSFCMCPGGFVIPASSDPNCLTVNGMSPARRNSPFANAAFVVELQPADLPTHLSGTLALMHYQEELEHLTLQHASGHQSAPAQRLTDFCARKTSTSLPPSSYTPGLTPSPLHLWLPASLTSRLPTAFAHFDHLHKGFLSQDATLIAIESRTSAPLRIHRHPTTGLALPGLFPAGEGAGFAGGIISSALDGLRAATSLATSLLS